MSSELQKQIENASLKGENLFNAEVINFPKEISINEFKELDTKKNTFWKITDESNNDQLKAVIGVCFMFGALILMGLYSSLT
jgi:hypothetical protein|tara:strand:- start:262 stop:507 length:246 start_codon:yes stop_codon:yes gene_type:complete